MSAVASTDAQLQWEAEKRRPAAIAAFLGGALSIAGFLVTVLGLSGVDPRSFVASIARFDQAGTIGDTRSLRLGPYQYFADHAATIVIGGIFVGLGAVAMGLALSYLSAAVGARRQPYPKAGLYVAVVGGTLMGLGSILSAVARVGYYDAIVDTSGTVDAVRDVSPGGIYYAGGFIQLIGGLVLALSFVYISLNAMRIGLLQRFMGIVGILAGALTVLPLPAVPILQAFWLIALGMLFLQVWPGGAVPLAWKTGKAEPPPSAAALREQRLAAQGQRRGTRPARTPKAAPPEPEAVEARAAASRPHPSSKKKRKRRA